MLNALLMFALVLLCALEVRSCSCLRSTLTEKFENEYVKTIGKFCNNKATSMPAGPSLPGPSGIIRLSPFERIGWKLTLKTVYKGDCSLKPGTVLAGSSAGNSAACGVSLGNGCYLMGLSERNSFNSCGLAAKFDRLDEATLTELAENNQCKGKNGYYWKSLFAFKAWCYRKGLKNLRQI